MQQKFSDSVLFKCHELSTEAPRSLIDLLNRPSSPSHTGTLNLTGHTLTSKLCSALAFALKDDDTYNSAIIGDCFLGDEGTIHLVNGLKTNHKVKHLDLRGNNIRSDGSTALSQMLKLNSTLESLSLEWNCIGIWETGTQAIADALANNHTLQEIDLRNNKIGPQGIQSLALALKHNTTLKRLDLRWNNAGIVGGRAIVECLKWNNTIIELDLTGNEIPEDILTSIAISIERNKENYRNQVHQSAHSAHLSSTIQALTTSHADTLRSYTTKFHSSESSRATLTSQLEKSVVEIKALSQINRDLESKLSTITAEKAQLEETLQDEKQKSLQRIDNLQRDLVSISESRLKSESTHGKQINELERRCFEIEALKNELEVKCEVLKRDKKMMIEDFDRAKEREQNLSNNMEEKIKKLQLVHQTKLAELTNELESAMKDRIKKAEEGCKNAEDALEYEKSKFATRKQQLEDKHNSLNEKWRRDEETLHKDHEVQLSSIRSQRDQLQQQLTASSQSHTRALLELEDTYFQKSSASRENHAKESESQNAKITALSHQNNTLILQLNELRDTSEREKRQIEDRIKNSVNSLEAKLAEKERENNELKAAVKRLCSELDDRDDEHVGKMKELQVAISTLITSGTRKHSSHLI